MFGFIHRDIIDSDIFNCYRIELILSPKICQKTGPCAAKIETKNPTNRITCHSS